MKTIPPICPEPETGPKYWRSLDQLAETPAFKEWVEKEFPAGASELTDPLTRRYFVKIMSASFMLAGLGLTGCRRPEEKIMPFGKMPENYIHGVPQFYATAMPIRGTAVPLVVKSNDGRPTKIEGNSEHPDSNGGTDQFAQASILNLYDPDRSIQFRGPPSMTTASREKALDFLSGLAAKSQANGGEGLCFLLEQSSSPSRARVIKQVGEKLPKAKFFVYEPVDLQAAGRGAGEAYGVSVAPYYKLDEAKVIVSLDSDFLGAEEDSYISVRRFAKSRKVRKAGDPMSRLYAVEALFTLTGANADHRLRTPASQVQSVAAALALEVFKATGKSLPAEFNTALQALAEPAKAQAKWVEGCAKDLLAPEKQAGNRSQGVVLAGHRQPPVVHLLALLINDALGSVGKTVVYLDTPKPETGSLADLAKLLEAGQVSTLVIAGGNPVYNAPADLNWKAAQRKAGTVIRLGYYNDETSEVADWQIPLLHYLESWGDARTADGTLVPVQPLIDPLFGGLTELALLARMGGLEKNHPYEIVRETFEGLGGKDENAWRKFLHDGFLANSAAKPAEVKFGWNTLDNSLALVQAAKPVAAPSAQKLEVVFYRSYSVDDGRFNNNGWLQETPDPITKLTWDNAILVSPKTAAELNLNGFSAEQRGNQVDRGLFFNQMVEITLNGRKVKGPVWIQPGFADNTLGMALGYGRERTGRVGRLQDGAPAGFNAYALRATGGESVASGASLAIIAGETRQMASTQEHGAMEGRPLIREANREQFEKHPAFAHNMDLDSPEETAHIPKDATGHPLPIYHRPQLTGVHQWGMTIDLTACVGCTSCMVACQSENNVPIVGKEQITKGREMSWIRLDRYFAGSIDDPQITYQPVTCMHCENAPCESVCPVNATTHDEEGLNVMTYNRCVGTRYCSNNCPYKVRRFNFFDYSRRPIGRLYKSSLASETDGEWEFKRWVKDRDRGSIPADQWDLIKMVKNPDVTVRMRGVMEKCTYCVQRIEGAKIAQKVKARGSDDIKVPDGTFKTACEQACPAEAIVFGDVSDPNSRVSELKKLQHDYSVLGFLDTRPRTTYLARIRNPNPEMPDYHESPAALQEYKDRSHADPMEEEEHAGKAGAGEHAEPAKGAH